MFQYLILILEIFLFDLLKCNFALGAITWALESKTFVPFFASPFSVSLQKLLYSFSEKIIRIGKKQTKTGIFEEVFRNSYKVPHLDASLFRLDLNSEQYRDQSLNDSMITEHAFKTTIVSTKDKNISHQLMFFKKIMLLLK